MRLKPFLPFVLLAMFLTACQTDFHGDAMSAINNKSLKIKDAKAFFEGNRPATTRTQGGGMSLGVSEKCSPDWSQAIESENEFLYCVEVPLTSGYRFVSTRKRRVGGKEIYLHQDVLRKLIVIKHKQTNELRMGVMSLVPSTHFKGGKPETSYDFNHFGDKYKYSGLVIYTNEVGTLVTTDFYRHGERILHHYVSRENPRMEIAQKIIGPVQIHAFDITTRIGADGFWWCTTCEKYHHKDDDIIECAPVIIGTEICNGCLNLITNCTCEWNNACYMCGEISCNCTDYWTCDGCGQSVDYCICSSACNECGEFYCTIDHQAENLVMDPVEEGRDCVINSDPNITTILNNFMNTNLGRMVYQKISLPTEIKLNQNHEGAMLVYTSGNHCYISVGNENLPADLTVAIWEELIHAAQYCEYGFDIMTSAKLNFEIEAKVMILQEICGTDDGVYNQHLDETGMFGHSFHALALHYCLVGYGNTGDQSFEDRYQESINGIRNTDSDYADEEKYPENSNYRNFNTFHE